MVDFPQNNRDIDQALHQKIPVDKKTHYGEKISNAMRSLFGYETDQARLTHALLNNDNGSVVQIIKSGLFLNNDFPIDEELAHQIVESSNTIGVHILMTQGLNERSRLHLLHEAKDFLEKGNEEQKKSAVEILSNRLSDLEFNPLSIEEREFFTVLYFAKNDLFDNEALKNDPSLREQLCRMAVNKAINEHNDNGMQLIEKRLQLNVPLTSEENRQIGKLYKWYFSSAFLLIKEEGLLDQKLAIEKVELMSNLLPKYSKVANEALKEWLNVDHLPVQHDEGYFRVASLLLHRAKIDKEFKDDVQKTLKKLIPNWYSSPLLIQFQKDLSGL